MVDNAAAPHWVPDGTSGSGLCRRYAGSAGIGATVAPPAGTTRRPGCTGAVATRSDVTRLTASYGWPTAAPVSSTSAPAEPLWDRFAVLLPRWPVFHPVATSSRRPLPPSRSWPGMSTTSRRLRRAAVVEDDPALAHTHRDIDPPGLAVDGRGVLAAVTGVLAVCDEFEVWHLSAA